MSDLFSYFVMGNAAFILGFSVVVLTHYAKHAQRHLFHIALMSTSFIILVFLTAGATNFRIFYDGDSRTIANIFLFIAMILADIALLTMWRARSGKLTRR